MEAKEEMSTFYVNLADIKHAAIPTFSGLPKAVGLRLKPKVFHIWLWLNSQSFLGLKAKVLRFLSKFRKFCS